MYLDLSDGIFLSRVEKQWRQSIPLFQSILNRKRIRQTFTCADLTAGLMFS